MAETLKVLDGEVVVDTARIEVLAVGSGAIVTVTMVDEDGTAIIAESEVIPKFSMDEATQAGSRLIAKTKHRLAVSVEAAGG